MANNTFETQDSIFAAVLVQLNDQFAQQVMMQKELQVVKSKLEQASKTLAQKDQLIGSLEQDLEHMVDQLEKIQHGRSMSSIKVETMAAVV